MYERSHSKTLGAEHRSPNSEQIDRDDLTQLHAPHNFDLIGASKDNFDLIGANQDGLERLKVSLLIAKTAPEGKFRPRRGMGFAHRTHTSQLLHVRACAYMRVHTYAC